VTGKTLKRIKNKIIEYFYEFLEKFIDVFVTYHGRPKQSHDVIVKNSYSLSLDSLQTGIVIQGPLILEDNFTIETIKLYKKIFPIIPIILSTWSDEDASTLDAIEELNIEVIKNEKPLIAGISNINLQIASSSAGISHARQLGCQYVLKTRTDQRIYSAQAIHFCYFALKTFPLINNNGQRERIVAFNLNTFLYRPYSISDMLNFGHIEDMEKYWCVEFDLRQLQSLPHTNTFLGWSKQKIAEVHFVVSFLKNFDEEIDWSLEGSWKVISERFCILNTHDIDLYWKKYSHKEFRHESYTSSKFRQINFADWLLFQYGIPENIPEDLALAPGDFQ
jgi:hypothetical protein